MKKKVVLGLLTILSVGMLAGAAEARPCNDRYRGNDWRNYRVSQARWNNHYNQNRWNNRWNNNNRFDRRDYYRSAYNPYNNRRAWW
jgi:hypothetical protein